ncbi:MAG: isocitrate lyase/PEP mutase family protein [Paracoccaceae bacterium]
MTQSDKARAFTALHQPGNPLVVFNIWDAGGAMALEKAGAAAVATGSFGVAAAMGYGDGEAIPLEELLYVVRRIAASVAVPVTIDFEGAYARDPAGVAANVSRLIGAGAIGLNFEDQVVGGGGLHDLATQSARIAAIRDAGDAAGVAIFMNARTDLFLKAPADQHAGLVPEALARAAAYAAAGASGFFVPGLVDPALMQAVTKGTPLPVNAMASPAQMPAATLAEVGVARISHGPFPWRAAMVALADGWRAATAHQT